MKEYFSKKNNCQIISFILLSFIIGVILLFHCLKHFYIIKTLTIGQCFVKSIDLKIEKLDHYPLWFITVTSNNQKNEDMIIGSHSYLLRYAAWDAANQYRINETYRCYRWKSLTTISGLEWQWDKPSIESHIGVFLFGGLVFFCISITILILKQVYQKQSQQNALPTYNEVMQTNS